MQTCFDLRKLSVPAYSYLYRIQPSACMSKLTLKIVVFKWQILLVAEHTWGGPKITGIIFFKWFIRFYTITTLVSFIVLSFWLDTLVPTAENISGTLQCRRFSRPLVFSFSLRWHQQNVSLSSGLSYEGTGKSHMAQGRVNREDEG